MQTDFYKTLTDDICFKHVFSHKEILTDFLNSFFKYIGKNKKVIEIEITTQKELFGNKRKNKVFYSDILAYLNTGEIICIEMYKKFQEREYKKSMAYLTRIYSNQLKEGEDHILAKKIINLNFMFGNYHSLNTTLINPYGFINKIHIQNLKDELIEMYLIRLDKVKNKVYNDNEKRFIKWLKLITAKTMEEIEKIGKDDKIMEQTIEFMKRFVNEDESKRIFDRMTYERCEGRDEGREEQALKTAKNMLNKGYEIEEIASLVGLSKEEIEALK